MRKDDWLAERLGCPAFTVESSDTELGVGPGFYQAKVDCARLDRVRTLEGMGMRIVDVNVTLRRHAAPETLPGLSVRDGTSADRAAVIAIAERDYTVSRFHLDPVVPDGLATGIKRGWAESFFAGTRGDRLTVVESNGSVAGFLLSLDGTEARTIDLIAVASDARRAGVGSALVADLLAMDPPRDVLVGTQISNVGSLRLYGRLGFIVDRTRYVLHGHQA